MGKDKGKYRNTKAITPSITKEDFKDQFKSRAEEQLQAFLKSGKVMTFPKFTKPELSIVIVTYTQTALELLCLMSILRWAEDTSYEVVISNNGTSDINKQLLSRLKNVKVINNAENLGFVKGANIGAENTSGKYLLFLNDDALVTFDCLQGLLRRIRHWKKTGVGVVGGQIRKLNNTIQDAGGILASDGTAAEYSKNRNPDIGEVNFVREVNYVSGALFMTPADLFFELNGFDEEFSPGYCEESDYCLRVREAGYKIIYEPTARVMHYEYGSSTEGTVSNLVKEHTALLLEKHKDTLAKNYHPSTPQVYSRSVEKYRGRVLIVHDFVPRSEYGDGKLVDYISKLVEAGFFVTLFPLYSGVEDWLSVHDNLPETVEVMLYEDINSLDKILSERPRYYDYFVSKVFDFSALVAKNNNFDGKYVIQLQDHEDYNCAKLLEILKPTALWVDWHIPEYDTNAGDYAVYSYCSALQQMGYKIRYWSDDPEWLKQNRKYGYKLVSENWEIWNSQFSFEDTLADLGHTVDLVVLARPLADRYIKPVRDWTAAPIIYYCHDLHYLREYRRCQNSEGNVSPADWEIIKGLKARELSIIERSDLLATVSQYEKEVIKKELPEAKVSVWNWYCPPKKEQPTRKEYSHNILFLGGLQHTPNLSAISWFLADIFPSIKQQDKLVKFNIVGSYIPDLIKELHDGDDINVIGFKEDLAEEFDNTAVFVAPVKFGAGLKGKIAMAMSYGVPVVTTSIGAEGMGLVNEKHVLIANTTEEFINAVVRLLTDNELWFKLATNSLEFAADNWSLKAVTRCISKDIRSINA